MIIHFLRIALRNIKKEKLYTLINISGLSIGLICAYLILLYTNHELSYDQFHRNANRMYRVGQINRIEEVEVREALTPPAIGNQLRSELTDIQSFIRFFSIGLNDGISVKLGEKLFLEKKASYVDSNFFEFFDFGILEGDPDLALTEPQSVVLSERAATRFSGDEKVLGRTIQIEQKSYKVTGIMRDMPENSHFHYDMLMSMASFDYGNSLKWNPSGMYTYVTTGKGSPAESLSKYFPDLIQKYYGEKIAAEVGIFLQPVTEIHLHSKLDWEVEPNGNIAYVRIFILTALAIILIACINFINLSTARSAKRAKEIGVRKTLGSSSSSLKWQFLSECVLHTIIALLVAIPISILLIKPFSSFTGTSLNPVGDPFLLVVLLAAAVISGLLAGSYSSFYLTMYNPVQALKGKVDGGGSDKRFRSSLVVFQFVVSSMLVMCTIIIYQQLDFLMSKEPGFEKHNTVIVSVADQDPQEIENFRNELLELPNIANVGVCSTLPSRTYAKSDVSLKRKDSPKVSMYFTFADMGFIPSMGINLAMGRNFSREFKSDSTAVIINSSAAKKLSLENPIGEYLESEWPISGSFKIVGVTNDFNFQSLREEVEPLIISAMPKWKNHMVIRLISGSATKNLASIRDAWDSSAPDKLFEYSFLDRDFDAMYGTEKKTGAVFIFFTGLAILIACLGLIGLSVNTIESKTKEIGIRKVLGVTSSNLIFNLTRRFVSPVLVGFLISIPISYLSMFAWLEQFAYRTEMKVSIFIFGGATMLIIAVLTIVGQTLKIAFSNPTRSLRYE